MPICKDNSDGYHFVHAHYTKIIKSSTFVLGGHAVAQLVEALRYKPESRGFDSR